MDTIRGQLTPIIKLCTIGNNIDLFDFVIMKDKTETTTIHSAIIENPRNDCIYELKAHRAPEGKIIIGLEGTQLSHIASINVATLEWTKKDGCRMHSQCDSPKPQSMSIESLPPGALNPKEFPIIQFADGHNFNFIVKRVINLDTGTSINRFCTITQVKASDNDTLRKECEVSSKGVPVKSGQFPFFRPAYRPTPYRLCKLYHQFWKYNKARLDEQYKISESLCHIRAHFINFLLSHYGIDSLKVFKSWNTEDWKKINSERAWNFHCAVMIIDAENNKWIWDPWIGKNSKLLHLDEWLLQANEPVPKELMIANRAVVSDYKEGFEVVLSFHQFATLTCQVTFQGLVASATPNPPSRAIPAVNHPFFRNTKKSENQKRMVENQGISEANVF